MKNIVNGIIEQSERLLNLYKKHKLKYEGKYNLTSNDLFLNYELYFSGNIVNGELLVDYQVLIFVRKNEHHQFLRIMNHYKLTSWSFEFEDVTMIDETELSTLLNILIQDVNTFEVKCNKQQLALF